MPERTDFAMSIDTGDPDRGAVGTSADRTI